MSDQQLPSPPVPPDCDLRGLPWMPVDTVRLLDSDLFALASGDEFKAAVALWCKAWQQFPAASLPNDERVLSHLSGMGKRWKRVRETALRGFVLCSDGRFYHSVIAQKALEAWEHREDFKETRNNKTERQNRWRERQKAISAQLHILGITPPKGATLKDLERLLVDSKKSTGASTVASTVDGDEMRLTETGTETVNSKNNVGLPPDASSPASRKNGHDPLKTRELRKIALRLLTFLNEKTGRVYQPVPANVDLIVARLKEGSTEEDCRAVIAKKCREWSTDVKMAEYLRPATLFGRTKFAQYRGEVGNG